MIILNREHLLEGVNNDIQNCTSEAFLLKNADLVELHMVSEAGSWNILQVLEHLNTYHAFYNTAIEEALDQHIPLFDTRQTFKPGIIGNYFVNMISPDGVRVVNKIKAAKQHRPGSTLHHHEVFAEFLRGQEKFSRLIGRAEAYDLEKIRVKISISKIVRLKLGDLLRFLAAHQRRHFIQIAHIQKRNQVLNTDHILA